MERKGEGKEGKEERVRRKRGRRVAALTVVRAKSLSQCPLLTCLVSLPFLYDDFHCYMITHESLQQMVNNYILPIVQAHVFISNDN